MTLIEKIEKLIGAEEMPEEGKVGILARPFHALPEPVKCLSIGALCRFDPKFRDLWIGSIIDAARDDGYNNPWIRRSFRMFQDEPTRELTNRQIDQALMEYAEKGRN